jgi:hypothetical protein
LGHEPPFDIWTRIVVNSLHELDGSFREFAGVTTVCTQDSPSGGTESDHATRSVFIEPVTRANLLAVCLPLERVETIVLDSRILLKGYA